MHKHTETFLQLDQLGTIYPAYRPTFNFRKPYINSTHKFFATGPLKDNTLIQLKNGRRWNGALIEGWLRRADALKLYELAYFAPGDILELGSYHGLSTTILSGANQRAPYRKQIYSVDLNSECVKQTASNLRLKGLSQGVTSICAEATAAVKDLAATGKKFAFVFIDHSHAYEAVYPVCQALSSVMLAGGFCLFHDFNDARNRDTADQAYGVYQAVLAGLDPALFEFWGIYGCTGLYRFK